ncbi:MAG TPA: LytTR family DNA-binding domain-containing protein [Symbiobacteriaceae bacterium]|nr:LytTR family DNA-binding domain-containing protein [Symbiobacteriaceae bacterium]
MLKVLIVDDEAPARRELRALLAGFPNVQVVGDAADSAEAEQLIGAIDYDAVFLDIQMPGRSGLDLARRLLTQPRHPRVIFTTAYPEYAVDAFGVGAVDYLLKPFDEERLARALYRLQGETPSAGPVVDRIAAERGSKTVLVPVGEIVFAFARNEEVWLKLHQEALLCRRYALRELEEKLANRGFLRVHRRFLVNLHKVGEVSSTYKQGLSVVMDDAAHTEVPISRSLLPTIKQRLGLTHGG